MDARFIKAFTMPGETNLLGYRMRPFSLKHRLALHAINSPFVIPNKQTSIIDLFIAVKICAEKPIRRLTFMDVVRLSYIKSNPEKFDEYCQKFIDHTNVLNWPKFWEKGKQQGGYKGVPWILALVSNLIANGFDEEAAWSLPECQAVWYHTANSMRNGNEVSLMTDEDEEIMKNFKQFASEAIAKSRIIKKQKQHEPS